MNFFNGIVVVCIEISFCAHGHIICRVCCRVVEKLLDSAHILTVNQKPARRDLVAFGPHCVEQKGAAKGLELRANRIGHGIANHLGLGRLAVLLRITGLQKGF
jgi:hypothetical protein